MSASPHDDLQTSDGASPVRCEQEGQTLWIRLSRPEAMNALDGPTMDGIEDGLRRSLEEDVRAVVIVGEGRAFCAGADLKFVRGAMSDASGLETFLGRAGEVFDRIEAHPLPVIAALNGLTIAGGLELAMACDFIVAAASAKIADGHSTFGLFPGAGGAVRLPRRVGNARAKLLLFTGRARSAQEMEAWGLVDLVVEDAALQATVQELCGEIAARSPAGLRRMKRVVNEQDALPVDRALRLELDACLLHMRSEDVAEGLAAFAERRAPQFRGR